MPTIAEIAYPPIRTCGVAFAIATSNGEPPPESGLDFWPTEPWLEGGGGVAVSSVRPCVVLVGARSVVCGVFDEFGADGAGADEDADADADGVACGELDDCSCCVLEDRSSCVVDGFADVLDVCSGTRVMLGCSVTTTILPQSLGSRFPNSATPIIDSAGTRTVMHRWLTISTILSRPLTQPALQLLISSFLSAGKSSLEQPAIGAL